MPPDNDRPRLKAGEVDLPGKFAVNQLPPHHAPAGLKIWLAVFGVVLVVALAYLVWASNTTPDTTDNSAVVTKNTTALKVGEGTITKGTDGFTTYTNAKLGFSFRYESNYCVDDTIDADAQEPGIQYFVVELYKAGTDRKCEPEKLLLSVYWFQNVTKSLTDFISQYIKDGNFVESSLTRADTIVDKQKAVSLTTAAVAGVVPGGFNTLVLKDDLGIAIAGSLEHVDGVTYDNLIKTFKFTK